VTEPIISHDARPTLHGSREWTRGYLLPMTIWNSSSPRERFAAYYAEAVQVEPGKQPVLLGIFYAFARSRAEPRRFEVNIWPLSSDARGPCAIGDKYPPPPLFIKSPGFETFEQLMSNLWIDVHSHVDCD
jgi:hypothetical protein